MRTTNRPGISPPPSPTSTSRAAPPTTAAPAAPLQRTAPAAPAPAPRGGDALDTSSIRPSARAGAPSSASIPTPPPPPVRTQTAAPSGPPQSVGSSLDAEILKNQKARLQKTDHGQVHPDLPGIRTRRDNLPAHEFADHTQDVRASTHKLMENNPNGTQSAGNKMLTDLNASTGRLNPGAQGGTPTAVDIHASGQMTHSPRMNFDEAGARQELAALRPGDKAGQQQVMQKYEQKAFLDQGAAYRASGHAGEGKASTVNYANPGAEKLQSPGSHQVAQSPDGRANGLGHEMTHAWRASNGVQVGTVDHANLGHHPAFHDANKAEPGGGKMLKDNINFHSRLKEEFETVGLQPTPGRPDAPSENKIRQQLGMPARTEYSGHTPQSAAGELAEMKQAPDNRTTWEQLRNKPIPGAQQRASDVQQIVDHLEK